MRRATRVLSGTLAAILQMLVAILLQILLMPRILATAGPATAGAYAILMQMLGYLALMDLGLYAAFGRSLSQSLGNAARFDHVLSGGLLLLSLLGILYAAAAGALTWVAPALFHLEGALAGQTQAALLAVAAWGLVRFPTGLFPTALMAMQDLNWPPIVGLLANLLRMIFALWVVGAGGGLLGLALANILAEVVQNGVMAVRFYRLHPGWRPHYNRLDWRLWRDEVTFGLRAFWGNLAGRVVFYTDNLVVGSLYGPAVTSVYYNTQQPIAISYSLVFRLADNAAPGINELWSQQAWERLRDIFLRLQRLTLLMVAPIVAGGWFYLGAVVSIWVGPQQFQGQGMTLWLVSFAALTVARYVPQVFLYASGDIQGLSLILIGESAANLALSIALGLWLGPAGVALATLIAHVPTAVYVQRRAQRDLKLSWTKWGRHMLLPVVLASAPTACAAWALSSLARPTSWPALGLHVAALGLIHLASSYLLGLEGPDRLAVGQLWQAAWRRARPTQTPL